MVVYFHKNPDIASNRQAQNYFREALAHELAHELLDANEKTHNENADVSASCEFKSLFRLTLRFSVSTTKEADVQNVTMRKINQISIRIRKHQTSVINAQRQEITRL